MNAPAYTETEKKVAKRLKKLVAEEIEHRVWSHMECLALVRKYEAQRDGRKAEAFAAFIYEQEKGS